MVSGSIVAFNIDFNRWHYEHQSRYWCRLQGGLRRNQPSIQWPGLVNSPNRRWNVTVCSSTCSEAKLHHLTNFIFSLSPSNVHCQPEHQLNRRERTCVSCPVDWLMPNSTQSIKHRPEWCSFQFETVKIPTNTNKKNIPVMSIYIIFVWQRSSAKHFSRNSKKDKTVNMFVCLSGPRFKCPAGLRVANGYIM